jgi:hypothetical protein
MAENELYAVHALTDDLKSEDTETRIDAMRKVHVVAASIGPERTCSELVPLLSGASRRVGLHRAAPRPRARAP